MDTSKYCGNCMHRIDYDPRFGVYDEGHTYPRCGHPEIVTKRFDMVQGEVVTCPPCRRAIVTCKLEKWAAEPRYPWPWR